MSSSTFVGSPDGPTAGFSPAPPPPPPPPPPGHGQVPAMRINTAQPPAQKRPAQMAGNDYEPPAAIQNAMMTKDKKPFTYTPGMGGKLDLSQIRSPRMARRVAKNANDEGIEGPPKPPVDASKPQVTQPSLFVHPQVAVPVFPTNVPVAPPVSVVRNPPAARVPPPAPERTVEPVRIVPAKVEPKMVSPPISSPNTPETPNTPSTPTQITLAKAPTPWMQNKTKQQEELPEWAKRAPGNKTPNSNPESPSVACIQVQPSQKSPPWQQQSQPQFPQTPVRQQPQPVQQPQYQQQPHYQQPSPPIQQHRVNDHQERVIPIRIEDRPSVFAAKNEAGHHQFKQSQPSSHHQQRWGQGPAQVQVQPVVHQGVPSPPVQNQSPQPQQSGGAYIIPIRVENDKRSTPVNQQTNVSNNYPQNSSPRVIIPQRNVPPMQAEPGPVQSRSFRVLQKITDTDVTDDPDSEQMRKLQLTEDDRILMNKFKEQVDGDTYLHQEEDPRYRGAAIPSRAFRYLQNMTDSGNVTTTQRSPNVVNKRLNRNSKSFEEAQANLPPSEQQAPEPKKYTGSAIPSRSFRILQAMTAPEVVATQEYRHADFTCQTENSSPGIQQGSYYPFCPAPYRAPDGTWWAYYPIPYASTQFLDVSSNSYLPYPDYVARDYAYRNDHEIDYVRRSDDHAQLDPSAILNAESPMDYPPRVENEETKSPDVSQESRQIYQARACESGPSISKNRLDAVKSSVSGPEPKIDNVNVFHQSNKARRKYAGSIESSVGSRKVIGKMNITEEETCKRTNAKLDNFVGHAQVYAYVDTSDSSETSDTDNETSGYRRDDKNLVDVSNSSSSDSESYVAYSTGHNPRRTEVDTNESTESTCSSDSLTDNDESDRRVDRLNVVNETRPDEANDFEGDDKEDDEGSATVSVSLPLRFKFSVSEDNEAVTTTVIVGDSTIRSDGPDDRREVLGFQGSEVEPSETTFFVNSVEEEEIDSTTTTIVEEETPLVSFTLKKRNTREERINESVETEFTIIRPIKELITIPEEKSESEVNVESKISEEEYPIARTQISKDASRDSREETDDEDSGVTSDMSRMISEVDTDSECASTRKLGKYQRTQTHSRLFRLLCDDSALAEPDEERLDNRREYLSLPLANYDDNCYSSDLTSPEYSPVFENWRKPGSRLANLVEREIASPEEDGYYRTWKTTREASRESPESSPGVNRWPGKFPVSCPRIKSTKSVPRALRCANPETPSSPSHAAYRC